MFTSILEGLHFSNVEGPNLRCVNIVNSSSR